MEEKRGVLLAVATPDGSATFDMTGLGYLGVDVILNRQRGTLLLIRSSILPRSTGAVISCRLFPGNCSTQDQVDAILADISCR